MKKLLLSILFLSLLLSLYSQDFFRGEFNKDKNYIILVHPTVHNIEVINYLISDGLLNIDLNRTELVGVYNSNQKYDFSASANYIAGHNLTAFHLYEVRGALTSETVYCNNPCSDDFRKIFENSEGVIFFGGEDIPPCLYGEQNIYSSTADSIRHYFEISFLFHLIGGTRNTSVTPLLEENPDYLVTGFCLGMQSMNVAAGGSLYQDIPAQIYNSNDPETTLKLDKNDLHRNYWPDIFKEDTVLMSSNLHPVQFTGNMFFGSKVMVPRESTPYVYSCHHQSVKDLAECFDVTALSHDGKIIEGIAHKKYPNVFAVQFHPEVSALYEDRAKVKFAPEDTPETLHSMLNRNSLKFHKKYWQYISEVIRQNTN